MLELFASHPDAPILTILFPCLQHRNGGPNTHDTRPSRREHAQTGIELNSVSQYEIENDLEVRVYDARQGRTQVLAMDVIGQLSLFLASHITAARHGHKGVQRDVKCRDHGTGL